VGLSLEIEKYWNGFEMQTRAGSKTLTYLLVKINEGS
jgi:hypothetical protein